MRIADDREGEVERSRGSDAVEEFLPLTAVEFEILLALAGEPLHGYRILKEVERRTEGRTTLHPGTLYRALDRLDESDLLAETAAPPETAGEDERRRYYRLTALGRRVAGAEARRLQSQVGAARARDLLEEAGPA